MPSFNWKAFENAVARAALAAVGKVMDKHAESFYAVVFHEFYAETHDVIAVPCLAANTIGAGITQIIAQASATGIALGATNNITVTPVATTVSPNTGTQGTTTVTITARNLLNATGITTSATGVSATITNVSANGQSMTATITVGSTATTGAKTLTINTPTGNPTFTFTVN